VTFVFWHSAATRIHIDTQLIDYSNDSRGRSSAVAVDGAYVYVFDHVVQALLRLPFDLNGPAEELARWTGTEWDAALSILVDGDFIYVNPHRGGTFGAVMRVPRCGGTPVILQKMTTRGRMELAGDWVFWGEDELGGVRRVHK
jgi:hypothetical protein